MNSSHKRQHYSTLQRLLFASVLYAIIVLVSSYFLFLRLSWKHILQLLIPVPTYAILFLLEKQKWISLRLADILAIFATPLLMIAMSYIFIFGSFDATTHPITDPALYQRILFTYRIVGGERRAHFPKRIPNEARNVLFYEIPKFMQGDNELFLAMNVSDKEYNDTLTMIQPLAKNMVTIQEIGQPEWDSLPWPSHYVPVTISDQAFFYVLHHQPYRENDFNHAVSYGIIMDEMTNLIIYYYSSW